jgi:hypothetical protein
MTIFFQRKPYRRIGRYPLLAMLLFAGAALPPSTALAQQGTALAQQETAKNVNSDETTEVAEIQTFQLRYVDADMAFSVLQTLLADEPDVRLAIGDDNRVIVRGTQPTLLKIRETLEVLDQAPEDRSVVKVFSLMHSEASRAAELVQQIVGGDVNVAVDVRTNSLVISAPSEVALDKVETLVQILDRGAEGGRAGISYNLELFWLIESGDDEEGDSTDAKPVDRRIANAAMELQRHGFVGVKQVGYLSVMVRPGGEFRVRSNESRGQLQMYGELEESGNQQLELKLDLSISDKNEEIASVMTEFNTRPEHEVVIAIARDHDRRSAFVIRVENQ